MKIIENDYRSRCCGSEVRMEGEPDFIGSNEVCIVHFVCLNCGEACDIKEKSRKMIARSVLHHDDPPCYGVIGDDGRCVICGIRPDMQSTCFWWECPLCEARLKNMQCPSCKETLREPEGDEGLSRA